MSVTDQTPRLGLPWLMPSQAQKHVTVNDSLSRLDALVMAAVESRSAGSPPALPGEGAAWIVPADGGTGWAGAANALCVFRDGAWLALVPATGWRVWVGDEGRLCVFDGTAWTVATGTPSEIQDLVRLGVGTSADAASPFSAKVNNALWTARYAGEGGNGDVRYTLNKEGAANVLSLLFQSNWTARAEIGLVGDDVLSLRTSADGSSFRTGVALDPSDGAVSFPSGLRRSGISGRAVLETASDITLRVPEDVGDIQSAIDMLGAVVFTGNARGRVDVAPGTYAISAPITMRHGQAGRIAIVGRSSPTALNASNFSGDAAADEAVLRNAFPIVVECSDCDGIALEGAEGIGRVENIAFIAVSGSGRAGLSLRGACYGEVIASAFFGFNNGASVRLQSYLNFTNDVVIAHSDSADALVEIGSFFQDIDGVWVHGGGASFNHGATGLLRRTVIDAANGVAVDIRNSSTVTLETCVLSNGGGSGLIAQNGSFANLDYVTVTGMSGSAAVMVREGSRARVNALTLGETGAKLVRAINMSFIEESGTHTGNPSFSPAVGTVSSDNSFIA